jgi:carbamoyl-phosphate synthase large subunit
MADATYIEPITWRDGVEKIIEKEKPDALLPTMGGQTALNCALDLAREGVLEKYGVEMIGATREAIDKAEDRDLFRQAMRRIGLDMPRSADRAQRWRRRARAGSCRIGFPDHHPPVLHHGRLRRRHRLQHRGVRGDLPAVSTCRPPPSC